MEPSTNTQQVSGEEQNSQLQDIATLLFEEFEDMCLPSANRDMGCNNTTNNVEMEANFVREKESSFGPTMLTCPLCGSLTDKSYLDEMLDVGMQIEDMNGTGNGSSSSSGGVVASQVNPFLNQGMSFEETRHDRNGMPIEKTDNNVIGSRSSCEGIMGFPMDHGGRVGVSNEVKATRFVGNAKTRTRRIRYKKGSPEAARQKELYKIRNREAAARSFEQKQAYIRNLELRVLTLRKENAF